jgi:nucleotide-binding universal stress UspA family protein
MTRIVVLIDGLHTEELLSGADRLVRLRDAELLLVYVRGPGPRASLDMIRRRTGGVRMPPRHERGIADAEQARAERALDEAEAIARGLATGVRRLEVDGDPGPAVCNVAVRERADMVVVRAGGRDLPSMGPRSLGPAARFIADHCPCSVLLFRAGT